MTKRGFVRARVDGEMVRLADKLKLDRHMKHNIEIVMDRVSADEKNRNRLLEAIESAIKLTDGLVLVIGEPANADGKPTEMLLSSRFACADCGVSFEPPSPQLFSFNSPQGMCLTCDGLGMHHTFDPDLLITDPERSIKEGAIVTLGSFKDMGRWRKHIFEGVAKTVGFSLETPWQDLDASAKQAFLFGTGDRHITYAWKSRGKVMYHGGQYEGIIPELVSKYKKTTSPTHRTMYEKYMRVISCPSCAGERLNPQARHVRVADRSIVSLAHLPVDELTTFIKEELPPKLSPLEQQIATQLLKEITTRLGFLVDVGLGYLSLDRTANTLSGGEAQRIRLASQIGSGLVDVLYVLDEPSIGLHPRDNAKLIETLKRLRDQGNTVIVVEHDEETMLAADFVVDFGPGPGVRGGHVVVQGTLDDIKQAADSVTGQFLSGRDEIAIPKSRRPVARLPELAKATSKTRKNAKA